MIRPINEMLGRHLAIYMYEKKGFMPDFRMEQLMSSPDMKAVEDGFDARKIRTGWLRNMCIHFDKRCQAKASADQRIYYSDVAVMYRMTRNIIRVHQAIGELGITGGELGIGEDDFRLFMEGRISLPTRRIVALTLASEMETREDFLYVYIKVWDASRDFSDGDFTMIPNYWWSGVSMQEWKDGYELEAAPPIS